MYLVAIVSASATEDNRLKSLTVFEIDEFKCCEVFVLLLIRLEKNKGQEPNPMITSYKSIYIIA
jgi:hypothetical protein